MWTKILIFMVVFFLVANPSTFKIMRKILGGWVASAEGVAKPGGLILHAAVFVALAIFLPRALMRASGYAEDDKEEYEDEKEEYEEGEEYADLQAEADLAAADAAKAAAQQRIAAAKARDAAAKVATPAVVAPGAAPIKTVSKYAGEEEFGGYSALY
jgi:hypothetical protein